MTSLSSCLELSILTHRQASGVGRLFSLFLKSCWPERGDGNEICEDKRLQHILSWKPMAQYFNYLGKLSGIGIIFFKNWPVIVNRSDTFFYQLIRIARGKIKFNDIFSR